MPYAKTLMNVSVVRGELRKRVIEAICLDILGRYGEESRLIREEPRLIGEDGSERMCCVVTYDEFLDIAARRWPRFMSWITAWRVFNEVCDAEGWPHGTVWLRYPRPIGWRHTYVAIIKERCDE